MSKENVVQFFEKTREDKELKEILKALYSEDDFHLEDLIQIAKENGELDDSQLEAVSGGAITFLIASLTFAAYGGFMVTLAGSALAYVGINKNING